MIDSEFLWSWRTTELIAAFREVDHRLCRPMKRYCSGSFPVTDQRVPHISLVFREMWDTTALQQPVFRSTGKEHKGSRIPHLAKNERDMGHPLVCGTRTKNTRTRNRLNRRAAPAWDRSKRHALREAKRRARPPLRLTGSYSSACPCRWFGLRKTSSPTGVPEKAHRAGR